MMSWEDLNRDYNKRKPTSLPIDNAFWFKRPYNLEAHGNKSTNDILREYLRENKIQYVNTYHGEVWFLFNGNWHNCDWVIENGEISFYMLEYIEN